MEGKKFCETVYRPKADSAPELIHSRKMCEVCGNAKVSGTQCKGCDQCIHGLDHGPAETCQGWGSYCCHCGADFASCQL